MEINNTWIKNSEKGIYLIIDPKQDAAETIEKLEIALTQHIIAVQIWDNGLTDDHKLLVPIIELCKKNTIPIIINNRFDLFEQFNFDGIHFDNIPKNWDSMKNHLNGLIVGITCTNDLQTIKWAAQEQIDYISFCSMFDSKNNSKCELVDIKTIQIAKEITDIPIILAGGITLDNLKLLSNLNYQAIAMISEIMSNPKPDQTIKTIYNQINNG